MSYLSKAEQEESWREEVRRQIDEVGMHDYACVAESYGRYPVCITLKDGRQRFWMNPSRETCEYLGLDPVYCGAAS